MVYLPEKPAAEEVVVECRYNEYAQTHRELLSGKKGLMHRMMDLTPEVKIVFAQYVDSYMMLPDSFLALAQCSSFIREDPKNAGKYLEEINPENLIDDLSKYESIPDDFIAKLKALTTLE